MIRDTQDIVSCSKLMMVKVDHWWDQIRSTEQLRATNVHGCVLASMHGRG